MMRRATILMLWVLLLAPAASAQITITTDLFEQLVEQDLTLTGYYSSDAARAAALVAQDGANQTWDFSALTYDETSTSSLRYRELPGDVPGSDDPDFAEADFAYVDETDGTFSSSFYDLTGGVLSMVGGRSNDEDEDVKLVYDPPVTLLVFPFTYGDSWSDTATQTIDAGSSGTFEGAYSIEVEVDGWGTLVTPAGTFEALRAAQQVEYSISGVTVSQELYTWYVRDGLVGATASCFSSLGTRQCSASYTVFEEGGGGGGTGAPSTPPTAVSPADGAADVARPATLSWAAMSGATGYDVQVATDDGFSSVVDEASTTGTSVSVDGLEAGTTYYWRVRATNSGGAGPYSAARSFTTESSLQAPSEAPADLSPADGATGVAVPVELTWATVEGAAEYEVDLATDAAFTDVVASASTSTAPITVTDLEEGTVYYWRVRAVNDAGPGPYTAVRSFTTEGGTGTAAEDDLPGRYTLHDNYPNPFNPTTTFAFDLAVPGRATLTVIDLAGRHVATVVDAYLPSGTFTYRWSAGDLPSGLYLYQLEAGSFRATKKLVLLK